MQISTELLHRYAVTTVEKLARVDYTVLSVYLTGSVATEQNPTLGGTTDIDLVFIHIGEPKTPREILFLNDDFHYDIAHHRQRDYLERLALRTHPWMGPVLSEAIVLYDPQHFMDLTQASVRGLFHQPNNVIQRARAQMKAARNLSLRFQPPPDDPGPKEVLNYISTLESAANAIALLTGEPLTERRFLLNFPIRAERIDRPGLSFGLLGMLGAPKVDNKTLTTWVDRWDEAFNALPKTGRHPRLHPYRRNYYLSAFKTILESDKPENILWPLLRTWSLAASTFTDMDPAYQQWRDACRGIGLLGSDFSERILALDAFLEQVEEAVTSWGKEQGAWT